MLSTAPCARPRRWTNYLARTEDRRQISLILAKATSWRLLLPRTRAVSDKVSDCQLLAITAESRGLTLLRKARTVSALWAYPGTSSTPFHRSDLDSGQLFVETVVLTSAVLRGTTPCTSAHVRITVVEHSSTLELQQAPVQIHSRRPRFSVYALCVSVRTLDSTLRRVFIVPSEL